MSNYIPNYMYVYMLEEILGEWEHKMQYLEDVPEKYEKLAEELVESIEATRTLAWKFARKLEKDEK